jgi:DnaJ-class molecular chaperone
MLRVAAVAAAGLFALRAPISANCLLGGENASISAFKSVKCSACEGSGKELCPESVELWGLGGKCNNGAIPFWHNDFGICFVCRGKGKVDCNKCSGRGWVHVVSNK